MTHQNGVYSYVLAMLRDRRDAEEVVQDAFIRAIRAIRGQYTDDQIETLQLRPWLLRIARNLALNRVRARKSRPITDSLDESLQVPDMSTFETVDEGDEGERLRRELERLEWERAEWLELRFINDLTYAEIAALKGGTEAAARGRCSGQ